MSEIEAINTFSKTFDINNVDAVVKVNDGFVFFIFSALQPVYVTQKGMYGLNGNKAEDLIIIEKADEILSKGGGLQ